MADRESLKMWVVQALKSNGGTARLVEVAKYIWDRHESELRKSGDLFYTWQYAMRWAATALRGDGILAKTKSGQPWELIK